MKDLKKNLNEVLGEIKNAEKAVFLSDFDGTLSKIARTPDKAVLAPGAKEVLEKLSQKVPVAIVSGRELKDVKEKVGINNLIYAGNHGAEWEINGKYFSLKFSQKTEQAVKSAKKDFEILAKNYPGIFVEEKKFAFSVHYRALDSKTAKKFLNDAQFVIEKIKKSGLAEVGYGKKVIDVKPSASGNKGLFVKFLLKSFKNSKKLTVIYLGDDKTDEDVFKALKNGITILVGHNKKSSAKYSLKNPTEVVAFLQKSYKIMVGDN